MRAALLPDDVAGTPGLRYEDFAADWSHPSAHGHALMAEALVALLARALEAPALHAHVRGGAHSAPAAAAVAAGEAAAVSALPPLVPGNYAETLGATCFFGDDLAAAVRASGTVPRHWAWDVSDPLKPGWALRANLSAAELAENALSLRFTAHAAATIAYVAGWDAGDARLACTGNCSCEAVVAAHRPLGRVMEQLLLSFDDTKGGAACVVTLQAVVDGVGHTGFKLLALIAGGPADRADEMHYGVDSITGDGRQAVAYGVAVGAPG